MKLQKPKELTSEVEVTNFDRHGLWLFVRGEEFFLPFSDFPWFREKKIVDVLNVELVHEDHLYWPALDIDLSVNSLKRPEEYPFVWQN